VTTGRTPHPADESTLHALLGAIEGLAVWYLDNHQEARALEAVPTLLSIVRGVYPFRP
jgi:hypothetical protein